MHRIHVSVVLFYLCSMIFTDTHAHLYLDAFDPDRREMVGRAVDAGVKYLLIPNIDKDSIDSMQALCDAFPDICFPMMGLHPTSVKEDYREQLKRVEDQLASGRKYIALGEIGIDLYWDKTFQSLQEEAFGYQLHLADRYNLPVAIHTRNSVDRVLDILTERKEQNNKGVFHCFGGNLAQGKRATELGFLLGIGGVVTYKNSGLQQVVEAIPLEFLLLETDAPFLPPVPHRGERNESAYIPLIASKIAEIRKISVEEVADVTTRNAAALFRIPLS